MTTPMTTSSAPVLGLAQAAKACGVSESTIRRKRPDLLAAGATQDSRGWRIPIPALVELGLMDRTTPPDTPETPSFVVQEAVMEPPVQSPLEPLVEALREKLAAAEQRAAVAEAVSAERERIIEAQAQTLRMITAGPSAQEESPAAPAQEPAREESSSAGPPVNYEQPSRFRRLLNRALR